jgi:hypothetical protein
MAPTTKAKKAISPDVISALPDGNSALWRRAALSRRLAAHFDLDQFPILTVDKGQIEAVAPPGAILGYSNFT